ncbi:carboxyl-terminal-processing peptidase 2, chloroplastic-like isoform X2 [Panicum virgatum]|nr:carboxyl-terminal-processing peptidase 2, chloroplastic-like isoform X2 [Panicum virgatum]XP_039846755.1 carboxyl-terminal-processing peptidase 2, chloroplastic-like isoform X2 [Panicum virgatum]
MAINGSPSGVSVMTATPDGPAAGILPGDIILAIDIYEADGADTIVASEPLVVLVNKGTASASEILAGALKDNKRAAVYGEPTYGKGKIQSVFGLSDGSGLAVTVARYETPAHTDIDKVGVIPDRPQPASFPTDEDGFCSCLRDSTAPCNLNAAQLFAKS